LTANERSYEIHTIKEFEECELYLYLLRLCITNENYFTFGAKDEDEGVVYINGFFLGVELFTSVESHRYWQVGVCDRTTIMKHIYDDRGIDVRGVGIIMGYK